MTLGKKDLDEFDKTFQEISNRGEDVANEAYLEYQMEVSPIAQRLSADFTVAEGDKALIEMRWLEDLRQYRGEYAPEILTKMHPKRSKANLSITKTKVKAVTARMTDTLFPVNNDKNWSIEITPIPDLSPDIVQNVATQLAEAGIDISDSRMLRKELAEEAKRRCDGMEREISDQLAELKYRSMIRKVIFSGNLYGTGVLKGPLTQEINVERFLPNGQGGWAKVVIPRVTPFAEFVPVWDIYPDMSARKPEDLKYVYQRHTLTKAQLQRLANRPDFDDKKIKAYVKAFPTGDAAVKNHEEQLRAMASGRETNSTVLGYFNKYQMLEYWGYVDREDLEQSDIKLDGSDSMVFLCNFFMLGDMLIKAVVAEVKNMNLPYNWYYYEKDETSIFGEGLAYMMRDPQRLFNAATRAMFDNAAISAGPLVEVNLSLLSPGESATDLYPFRVFQREGIGADAGVAAVRVYDVGNHTPQYLELIKFILEVGDEITTIPRFMYGESTNLRGGATRTAAGMSMLMGAANITLKEQVKNFDDGVTRPFIGATYQWNMMFNPKEDIKGDFQVVAKGSTSMVAKEVRMEAIAQVLGLFGNEIFAKYLHFDRVLKEAFKAMDLEDLGLVKDENQVAVEDEQAAAVAEEDKNFEKELAVLKATSGGHMGGAGAQEAPQVDPEEELGNLMAGIIPQQGAM